MFNYNKMMFLMMMIISVLIIMNSSNWMGIWMGMEINLMMFIPFLSSENKKKSQAMMIYFLTQSIGSMIMLFSILLNSLMMVSPAIVNDLFMMSLMMSLFLKLGVAPLHSWFPEMMNYINWLEMILLMTIQKFPPLLMLSNLNLNKYMLYISIILSALIGAIGGLNSVSMRKIMAYSSINHMSWMMLYMSMQTSWYMYMIIYSLMTTLTGLYFNMYNAYSMIQIINKTSSLLEKYSCSSILLSMGGLPPFLGFLPKWLVIQSSMNNNMIMLLTLLIMLSMLTLFYYMRMISPIMMSYTSSNKWIKQNNYQLINIISYLNLLLPIMMIMNFI